MTLMLDSFWRALAYLFMPRIIGLSLMPLAVAGGLTLVMGYFFWTDAVTAVRATLESWRLIESLLQWLDAMGLQAFRSALAAVVVLAGVLPVVLLLSLLLVALCAVTCDADDWVHVAEWGRAKLEWLRRFLPFESGVASHDTFSRNTRLQLRQLLDAVRELTTPPEPPKRPIGFLTHEDKAAPKASRLIKGKKVP